jgi:hypothetical protein
MKTNNNKYANISSRVKRAWVIGKEGGKTNIFCTIHCEATAAFVLL